LRECGAHRLSDRQLDTLSILKKSIEWDFAKKGLLIISCSLKEFVGVPDRIGDMDGLQVDTRKQPVCVT